jgi:hypothetical protein
VGWVTTLVEAYKDKESLGKMLSGGLEWALGKKTTIAFTGMEGVGKTVLFDHLTRKSEKPGYKLPHRSQKLEKGKVDGEKRLVLHVIPGQDSNPRHCAIEELFLGKVPVDGIIHVVSFGYSVIREEQSKWILVQDRNISTLTKFLNYQRKREIADLEATCDAIRQSHRRFHKPTWMVIALDTVDLYADKDEEARTRYQDPTGEFHQRLVELQNQVGRDFFRWELLPVCAYPQQFEWNGKIVIPQFGIDQRDILLAQFLDRLKSFGN